MIKRGVMNNSKSWRNIYDTSEYGNRYPSSYFVSLFYTRIKDLLLNDNEVIDDKNVLDFGCGVGANSRMLCEIGMNTYGIDVSPRAIERLLGFGGIVHKEHFKVVNLLSDIRINDVFDNVKFDLIFASEIMYYFSNYEQKTLITKFMDVMKPGAILYASIPTYDLSVYKDYKDIPKNEHGMIEVKETGRIKDSLWVNIPRNKEELEGMFSPLEIIDIMTVDMPMYSDIAMKEYHLLARK